MRLCARFPNEWEAAGRAELFWKVLAANHHQFSEERNMLLDERVIKQDKLDAWLQAHPNHSADDLEGALVEIGYKPDNVVLDGELRATTSGMPSEITTPGPQLVVPANDTKMVIGAMNARWGSLIEAADTKFHKQLWDQDHHNASRFMFSALNDIFSFGEDVSLSGLSDFRFKDGRLFASDLEGAEQIFQPKSDQRFLGFTLNEDGERKGLLLQNKGLRVELVLDDDDHIADARLEAALTVIVDKEDSTVSHPDIKAQAESNIANIMSGKLSFEHPERGEISLADPVVYEDPFDLVQPDGDDDAEPVPSIKQISGTAQLLVRSVSDHMKLPKSAVTIGGIAVSEKTWDLALNAVMGVEYHVLPKMHNEQEVELAMRELEALEDALGYERGHFKVNIMNEEFEMNLRLRQALAACRDRVFFVNSGFLDKFGSDLEAFMQAGPVASYRDLANVAIKVEYEKHNAAVGVAANIAQVGAGMWPQIRNPIGHRDSKKAQIHAGNDVSWDPNPNMATLHALYYHQERTVHSIQQDMKHSPRPLFDGQSLFAFPYGNFDESAAGDEAENYISSEQVQSDLRDALYGLVGYAQPWVENGVGCSAIADSDGTLLMEDRATARIKVAFVRNWLLHGIVDEDQIEETLQEVVRAIEANVYEMSQNVISAVEELVFNPAGRVEALVDDPFMRGHMREMGYPAEETVPKTPADKLRDARRANAGGEEPDTAPV